MFTTPELVREAERELKQRERVYPRLVAAGKLSRQQADRQTALQVAIIEKLREDDAAERLI